MLKVLYLIDTLEGYGAEKSLVEITQNFNTITPVFVHIYQGDMLKANLESSGIKVYSLDIDKKYAFKLAVEKLIPIYLKEKPDLVHATLFRSEIIARKLKKIFRKISLIGSFVSNAYSSDRYKTNDPLQNLKLRYFHNIDRKTVKHVDYFISNSKTIKDISGAALGVPAWKIKVIYRGRSSSAFCNSRSERLEGPTPFLNNYDRLILLNVSRLISLKGQLDLLRVLPGIIKEFPEVKLLLAGHGPFRRELEKGVKRWNLQNHVEFLGRIENINTLLNHSKIFLYPSYSEGLPGALIEAMMAEKIIICSDIPVNLECVDKHSALVYKKGDISELQALVRKVLKNPEAYKSLGRAARKKAKEKFELSKVVTSYEHFYHQLLEKKANRILKVLHLIQKPQPRGAEIFTCQLANHQKELGMEVQIASIFEGGAVLDWKGEIKNLKGSGASRFFDFRAWKNLNNLITDFQPDFVQANAGDTLKYAVFSKKVFGWKTPIIFRNASEVGRYLRSGLQLKLNKYLYQNIEGVVSVSNCSEKDLLKHFPNLKGKTTVVPIGLERKKDIPLIELSSEESKHIIHIGGFSFEKNHKGLINIFQKVLKNRKDVKLHLIGDGPLLPEIKNLIKEKKLSDVVYFHGFVNNPLSFIKSGNLLVLPSIIEGLPGVILEAMYCKTPVVAYDVGGISEVVNRDTGSLIAKGNEEEFATAILRNLEQPDYSQIEKAHKMVTEKFMNKKLTKNFLEFYREMID
ncbi:Glycosyltransferase involved in cell wall bisynthesis [Salinimicrobium sediminis]|uniref:Glycosyltransferase involved in cell wall bisynthesis n=1 Tax=Salinimicrobium sediminis TaxID=1343891 RepID=A0A285X4P6_9FLAO|nr:glycosyltransferase [Salinimicrobium sediminis]SOC80323.1 Glycosyltransferase involved in cell wall bisynthesis [Salinimicrobium sediminis]